jgi:hypothetical protein
MPIRLHRFLVLGLVYGLGAVGGGVAAGFAYALAISALHLPPANAGSAAGNTLAFVAFVVVTASFYWGGVGAARLAQRWLPARCPACGKAAARARFETITQCRYECSDCGRAWPPEPEVDRPPDGLARPRSRRTKE